MSSEKPRFSWNNWIREFHRWMSIAFVAAVVFTFFGLRQPNPPQWMSFVCLPFLALLTLTGVYLFALRYVNKLRSRRLARNDEAFAHRSLG